MKKLDNIFKHDDWYVGHNRTIRSVLDEMARTGDYELHTYEKYNTKIGSSVRLVGESQSKSTGNIAYLKYAGKEGGRYPLNSNLLEFYQDRYKYWWENFNPNEIKIDVDGKKYKYSFFDDDDKSENSIYTFREIQSHQKAEVKKSFYDEQGKWFKRTDKRVSLMNRLEKLTSKAYKGIVTEEYRLLIWEVLAATHK